MRETQERLIILGTILVISAGALSSFLIKSEEARAAIVPEFKGSWACVADIEMCPDGRTVSRVGPYCHFASCE
jgi:hypothetical protein